MPFEFDVSGKLRPKGNLLVLRVDNRPRLTWLPGAKQIESIQYGGILEPVTLETSSRIYRSDLTVDAVPEGAGMRPLLVYRLPHGKPPAEMRC